MRHDQLERQNKIRTAKKILDERLEEIIIEKVALTKYEAREAFEVLATLVLDLPVVGVEPGTPFLTEAYLYELVGKEDARTILSAVDRLGEAIGTRLRTAQRGDEPVIQRSLAVVMADEVERSQRDARSAWNAQRKYMVEMGKVCELLGLHEINKVEPERITEAVRALVDKDEPEVEVKPICMACDGCGWVEGGAQSIQTTCSRCKGTGEAS